MNRSTLSLATGLVLAAATLGAQAQIQIDQAAALAGNVTPGDAPGFPVRLTTPGHYVLTGNLTVPVNVAGIQIAADDVTLDLNGFAVAGPVTCEQHAYTLAINCNLVQVEDLPTARSGIVSFNRNSTVRNGTVRGFLGHGLYNLATVENMNVYANTSSGIRFAAGHSVINQLQVLRSSRVSHNVKDGVEGTHIFVQDSVLSKNGMSGLATAQSTVRNSVLSNNGQRGIDKAFTNFSTSVSGSDLSYNKAGSKHANVRSLGGNFDGSHPF